MKMFLARLFRGLADAIDPPRTDERRDHPALAPGWQGWSYALYPDGRIEHVVSDGLNAPLPGELEDPIGGWGGPYV